jgi:hypothetical protein
MNDGTVENGQALRTGDSGVDDAGFGGNVVVMTSTDANSGFYLNGGTVKGGSAPSGGNVRINNNAKMVMTGGTIESSATGDNVFINITGSLTMSDGIIRNAAAVNVTINGIASSKGLFTMTGGTVYLAGDGTNMNVYGTFNMSGESAVVGAKVNYGINAASCSITGGYVSSLFGQPKANASGGYFVTAPGADFIASGATVQTLGTPVQKTIEGTDFTFGYQLQ